LRIPNYTTVKTRIFLQADELLKERMTSHESLVKKVKSLHSENQRLRVAQEAVFAYRRKKEENPGFKLSK